MKKLTLLLAFIITGLTVRAQCEVPAGSLVNGENLQYNLYFNWKFVWIKAGTASLKTQSLSYEGRPAFRTALLAHTNKQADMIFRMRDTISTVVTPEVVPLYFRKRCDEGKQMIYDRAWFSYHDGECTANQTKIYEDGRQVDTEFTDSRCIYDMVSLLLHSRSINTSKLKVGQVLTYPMVTGVKVQEQYLIYLGKEKVEALSGTVYRCQVFSLVKYKTKEGKKVQEEIIRFYATDDKNHLPIQLDLNLRFGSAKARLSRIEGNRYPFTSIVK